MLSEEMLLQIEKELKRQVSRLDAPRTQPFHEMLTYHMGWTGEGHGVLAQGKRLRPLIVLLCTASCEQDWLRALPASASVELVHNFSLVHDDIQDNSDARRGRTTLWKKWGMPQGINAGDALFAISNLALLDLRPLFSDDIVLKTQQILSSTCLDLTRGQFLDMQYETLTSLAIDDYWPMVAGKTAALLAACCHLGALLGFAEENRMECFRLFGHYLGLAFQVEDDLLGIWGDASQTGKSIESDLITGKKSLPVLIGLRKQGNFAKRWLKGQIQPEEIPWLSEELDREGTHLEVLQVADQMHELAIQSLQNADPKGDAGTELFSLVSKLVGRAS